MKKRWKIYRTNQWRDNREGAYRNLPDLIVSKGLIVPFGIVSSLATFAAFQFIYSLFDWAYVDLHRSLGHQESFSFWETFFSFSIYHEYPLVSFGLWFIVILAIVILCLTMRRSYLALEDRFTAATSRFAERKELVQQYSFMPSDLSEPYDGEPGLPVAHFSYEEADGLYKQLYDEAKSLKFRFKIKFLHHKPMSLPPMPKITYVDESREDDTANNKFLISLATEVTNVCCIGITRAGKKVFFVSPVLDAYSRSTNDANKASFIVADPKGELLRENYKMLKERGYKIKILNLMRTYQSSSYNPFYIATEYYAKYLNPKLKQEERSEALDNAQKTIDNIGFTFYDNPDAKEPMWSDNAQLFFTAVSMLVIEQCLRLGQRNRISIYTVATTINSMSENTIDSADHPYLQKYAKDDAKKLHSLWLRYRGKNTLDVLFGELEQSHPAKILFAAIKMAGKADATIGGIASHVFSALKTFIQSGNATLMARNEFDFEEIGFGDKPVATFMIIPDQDKSNHKLATFFIEQSYKVLTDCAFLSPKEKCDRPVIYLLDEMGNLPVIKDFDTKISASLGRNIRFYIILQSFSQLNKYPDGINNTILSNCGYLFYIKSPDTESTNDLVSKRLGKRAVLNVNRSGHWLSIRKQETEMVEKPELMTVTELEQLQFGENVILRIMKNDDLAGDPITAYPILNQGDFRLHKYYEYLNFPKVDWSDIVEANSGAHRNLELKDLLVTLLPNKEIEEMNPKNMKPDPENITSPTNQKRLTERQIKRMRLFHQSMDKEEARNQKCQTYFTNKQIDAIHRVVKKNVIEEGYLQTIYEQIEKSETTVEDFFILLTSIETEECFNKVRNRIDTLIEEVKMGEPV